VIKPIAMTMGNHGLMVPKKRETENNEQKSTGDRSLDEMTESLVGNTDIEQSFSVSVQKKRQRLLEAMKTKKGFELVIKPHRKSYKGAQVHNFRGSRFRGISKNGNSWQILVMVNRKKKYLGTLPSEEAAAKFYDKVAIQY